MEELITPTCTNCKYFHEYYVKEGYSIYRSGKGKCRNNNVVEIPKNFHIEYVDYEPCKSWERADEESPIMQIKRCLAHIKWNMQEIEGVLSKIDENNSKS